MDNSEAMKCLITWTRPLCYKINREDYPYGCQGSCCCLFFEGEYFILTAKHVLRGTVDFDAIKPHDVLVGYENGSRLFLPIKDAYTISTGETDDSDHQDIAIFHVWKEKLEVGSFDRNHFYPLAANFRVSLTEKSRFFAVGWPDERNYPDYEEEKLIHQPTVAPLELNKTGASLFVDEFKVILSGDLKTSSGFSGGGVFSLTPRSCDVAEVRFEGMTIRGGPPHGYLRMISAAWLTEVMKRNLESRGGERSEYQ